MSSGHYCVIRDLGLVKGGKGLRHHEVVLDLSARGLWRGAVAFAKSAWSTPAEQSGAEGDAGAIAVQTALTPQPVLAPHPTRGTRH